MPSCDKLVVIALIRWLQNKIRRECPPSAGIDCALESLEEAKITLEELGAIR